MQNIYTGGFNTKGRRVTEERPSRRSRGEDRATGAFFGHEMTFTYSRGQVYDLE